MKTVATLRETKYVGRSGQKVTTLKLLPFSKGGKHGYGLLFIPLIFLSCLKAFNLYCNRIPTKSSIQYRLTLMSKGELGLRLTGLQDFIDERKFENLLGNCRRR